MILVGRVPRNTIANHQCRTVAEAGRFIVQSLSYIRELVSSGYSECCSNTGGLQGDRRTGGR
eukprot:1105378-Rhodomonas_salina.2